MVRITNYDIERLQFLNFSSIHSLHAIEMYIINMIRTNDAIFIFIMQVKMVFQSELVKII